MVTFTWPSIAPQVAVGPRQRLNQVQEPMDAENREEMDANLKAGDVQKRPRVYLPRTPSHQLLGLTLHGKHELCGDNVASVHW